MRHTEITESPRKSCDYVQKVVRLALARSFGIRRNERKITGKLFCVFRNSRDAACRHGGIYQYKHNSHGHNNALDKVGGRGGKKSARSRVANYYYCRNQHCGHIIHTEQRRKQLSAGGKARRRIGNEKYYYNQSRHTR